MTPSQTINTSKINKLMGSYPLTRMQLQGIEVEGVMTALGPHWLRSERKDACSPPANPVWGCMRWTRLLLTGWDRRGGHGIRHRLLTLLARQVGEGTKGEGAGVGGGGWYKHTFLTFSGGLWPGWCWYWCCGRRRPQDWSSWMRHGSAGPAPAVVGTPRPPPLNSWLPCRGPGVLTQPPSRPARDPGLGSRGAGGTGPRRARGLGNR